MAETITNITLSGAYVYVTIDRAITQIDGSGVILYTPNVIDSKKLQGLSGAKVAAFTETVTNNVIG